MKRWLALLILFMASLAHAEGTLPPTELQKAVTSKSEWLNTSRPLKAEDLQGRIVLLDFWTLGCINCMDIIPDLKSLEQEFGNNLAVIGVHSAKFADEKQTDSIRAAVMRYGVTHPVVNDSDFAIWNAFGVKAWPTLVLLSPDGKIASVYAGEGNKAAIETDIKKLLDMYKGKLVATALPLAAEAAKLPESPLRFPGKIMAGAWGTIVKTLPAALFIADSGHNRILVTDFNGTILNTIGSGAAGLKDGNAGEAQFYKPQGIAQIAHNVGPLYVADLGNHALREITLSHDGSVSVTTLAGTGEQGHFLTDTKEHDARTTPLASPWAVAFWPDEKHLAIAMAGAHQIWGYDIDKHTVSLLAGNGREDIVDGHEPFASLAQPSGLFAAGDNLYFTDAESSALRVLDKDGTVTTLIGKGLFDFGYKEGSAEDGRLQHPLSVTGDAENLYVADTYNHSIRRYNLKEGKLYNYAGHNIRGKADGTLAEASFNEPGGITRLGDTLYVADTNNHEIRAIDMKAGKVSTLIGSSPIRGEAGRGADMAVTAPASPHPAPPPTGEGMRKPDPNAEKHVYDIAADSPIDIDLELKDGWHINDIALSQLSLMNGRVPVTSFARDTLRTLHFTLPKLKPGGFYYLDGILYYCKDARSSLCMIKSFDVKLVLKGTDTKITLPVN